MNCPNCRIKILSSSKFCKHCGIEITTFRNQGTQEKKENYNSSYVQRPVVRSNKKWLGWIIFLGIVGLLILANGSSNSNNNQTPAGVSNPEPPTCSEPAVGEVFNSMSNGAQINSNNIYFNGKGQLTIKNGTEDDAVVKIINANKASIGEYYIDANNEYTINDIVDGNYSLYFSLGKNWDEQGNKFITCKSFAKFDDNFNYITTYAQYTTYSVTLNPVIGGTANTTSVDESAFNSY